MDTFTTALHYLNKGIATLPLGYRSKRPDNGMLGGWKKYQTQLPTEDEVRQWFSTPYRNIAIVTGWQNLVIIDFDNVALYRAWRRVYPHLDTTYKVKTRRGYHLYFHIEDAPDTGLKFTGIDVKAAGGYCLIPPSIHPTGSKYTAIAGKIITVAHLENILPKKIMDAAPQKQHTRLSPLPDLPDLSDPLLMYNSVDYIKQSRKVLDYFPNARLTSNNGRWYSVRCPLHNDRHNSGWIDTDRNRYGCQACINGSMDVIELHARLNNIDCSNAIRELAP